MRKRTTRMLGALVAVVALAPITEVGAQSCPAELGQAKAALERAPGAEQQLPRTLAGSRQEIQAPRGQEIQAPRGQEIQAPRGQEIQAPRGQEIQAPRSAVGMKSQAAAALIEEAETACQQGNMTLSAEKARAALQALQ